MKFVNTRNGKVVIDAEQNEKTKTYLLTFEDGTNTSVSPSTFKRWYKKVQDDEEVEVQVDEEVAGDGTPLADVGKEIAKQAKEKAKKVKKEKKEKKSSAPQFDSTELREYIKTYVQSKSDGSVTTRKKSNGTVVSKLIFKVNGHAFSTMTFSKSNIAIRVRPETSEVTPNRVINHMFSDIYTFTEDTEDVRNSVNALIDAAYDKQLERKNKKSKED